MDSAEPQPRSPNATQVERRASLETRWFPRLRAWLLGYDVFISYRHFDGLGYAMALQNRLKARDLAVFRDVQELPAGSPLEGWIRKALARSRMLVVVATSRARDEQSWVAREVAAFPKGRPIVAIRFDAGASTWPALMAVERKWVPEEMKALDPPQPSDRVVDEIEGARTFARVNFLGRLSVAAVAVALATLAWGVWHEATARAIEAERARVEKASAEGRRYAAESEATRTGAPSQLPRSLAAALRAVAAEDGLESARALRRALALTPPLMARQSIDCTPDLVSWSEDTIAVAGWSGASYAACIIDRAHGRPPRTIKLAYWPTAIAVRGQLVAIGTRGFGEEGALLLLDAWTDTPRCPAVPGNFRSLAISEDGSRVVTVEWSGTIARIALQTCARTPLDDVAAIKRIPELERSAELSSSGDYLIVSSKQDQSIYRLSERKLVPVVTKPRDPGGARPVVLRDLFVFSSLGRVEGISLPGTLPQWSVPSAPVASLAFKNGILLIHTNAGTALTVSPRNGGPLGPTSQVSGSPPKWGSELSSTGRDLITVDQDPGGASHTARLWDRVTGSEVARLFHTTSTWAVLEGPAGSYITIGNDHEVRFWGDIHRVEPEISLSEAVVALDLDGAHVAIAGGKQLSIWSAADGELERAVAFDSEVMAVSLHGDALVVGTSTGLFDWHWKDARARPVPGRTWPFHAVAVAMDRFCEELNAVAIDGKGNGIRYRRSQPERVESLHYANPGQSHLLAPNASGALSVCADAVAIALFGGVAFASLSGRPVPAFAPTYYQLRAIAFAPGGWLALSSDVRPKDSFRNPDPALEIVWPASNQRSRITLALDGYQSGIAIDPTGSAIAISVGTIVQVWAAPAEGAPVQQLLHQIELPWPVYGLRYARQGELWVIGEKRVRRIVLDSKRNAIEARRRLGDLLLADAN
jgi:hypothetical protein